MTYTGNHTATDATGSHWRITKYYFTWHIFKNGKIEGFSNTFNGAKREVRGFIEGMCK